MSARAIQHDPAFSALLEAYRLITFVGSGGKTSLIQWAASIALAKKLRTIITTTTKIYPLPGECVILLDNDPDYLSTIRERLTTLSTVVVASRFDALTGKLIGLQPRTVSSLHHAGLADLILVEADGAARKPLKAPNATEPVIPQETDLCIAVMGLDAAYKPLCETTVHRSEIFSFVTGRSKGMAIMPEDMFCIATAPNGLFRGCPPNPDLVVFLNKTDHPGFDLLVDRFASLLESESHLKGRWFAGSALRCQAREITMPHAAPGNTPPISEVARKS